MAYCLLCSVSALPGRFVCGDWKDGNGVFLSSLSWPCQGSFVILWTVEEAGQRDSSGGGILAEVSHSPISGVLPR